MTNRAGGPNLSRRAAIGLAGAAAFGALAARCGGHRGHRPSAPQYSADVVIYGSNMAAVVAAIQVHRMGRSVVLVSPAEGLGGLTTSGLGWTDSKWSGAIGGIAREFYHAIWSRYSTTDLWAASDRSTFMSRVSGQTGFALDDRLRLMIVFEPRIAQEVVDEWIHSAGIRVVVGRLDRERGVVRSGTRIRSMATENGHVLAGSMFIDTTYEGDLMAAAGVRYRVGRDGVSEFREHLAGVRVNSVQQFRPISPYVVPDQPTSGLLPGVEGGFDLADIGSADPSRVQSYCFRLCLSQDPANQRPLDRPDDYDPARYELALRFYEAGLGSQPFTNRTELPNGKLDANNAPGVSLDFLGGNRTPDGVPWPEASYAEREVMFGAHKSYTQGFLWAMRHEPRVPAGIRQIANHWAFAKDEFSGTDGWPTQLYVREGRRMVGREVVTARHARDLAAAPADSVGMASYSLDSHAARRVVVDGSIRVEGYFNDRIPEPWAVPYGALVPFEGTTNLLVPGAISATHVAYSSLRMEPTFMALAQSAATSAVHALDSRTDVQDVDYEALARRLRADGQRLVSADLRG